MADSTLKLLGTFIGEKFASLKGNVTTDYNSLEKVENIIKTLDRVVKGSDGGEDFDTLAKISAYLKTNKTSIAAISGKADASSVVTKKDLGTFAEFTTAFDTANSPVS